MTTLSREALFQNIIPSQPPAGPYYESLSPAGTVSRCASIIQNSPLLAQLDWITIPSMAQDDNPFARRWREMRAIFRDAPILADMHWKGNQGTRGDVVFPEIEIMSTALPEALASQQRYR